MKVARLCFKAPPDYRGSRGFALIIVLWTLVLIGFLVAHVTASGRTEIRIAGNLVANSAAQAAADGAIFDAIFNLSNPQPEQRWPVDGTAQQVAIGASRVVIRLEDEASWINPSTASPLLLEALLRATGSDPDNARRLATAISEWVGSASIPRPQEAMMAEYRAAGLDYAPPSGPVESLAELGRVLGMTPAVLSAIRPHLTLYGPPEPTAATSDPIVAAALALSSPSGPGASPVAAQASQTAPDVLTVRVTALAVGPANARVMRRAILRTGGAPPGYSVLAWGNALDDDAPTAPTRPPAFTR
jgi:general secretion pathway protein K